MGSWDFQPSPYPSPRHARRSSANVARDRALSSNLQQPSHHHHTASAHPQPSATFEPFLHQSKREKFEETKAVSFTWVINDVALLRDEVEHSSAPGADADAAAINAVPSLSTEFQQELLDDAEEDETESAPSDGETTADGIVRSVSAGAGRSEVWNTEPTFGDGQWKVELVRRQIAVASAPTPDSSTFGLSRTLEQTRRPISSYPFPSGQGRKDNLRISSVSPSTIPVSLGPMKGSASGPSISRQYKRRKAQTVTTLCVYLIHCAPLNRKPPGFASSEVAPLTASIMVGVRPLSALPPPSKGASVSYVGNSAALDPAPYLHQSFHTFTFSHDQEYFACHDIPPLSKLLEHPDVRRLDAVALTINIVTGAGTGLMRSSHPPGTEISKQEVSQSNQSLGMGPPTVLFPQPDTRYVTPSILDALASLLDCPRSGDVCIRARERGVAYMPVGWAATQLMRLAESMQAYRGRSNSHIASLEMDEYAEHSSAMDLETDPTGDPQTSSSNSARKRLPPVPISHIPDTMVQPFPLGSELPPPNTPNASESTGLHSDQNEREQLEPVVVVRDRFIWAHSAILKARSAYFGTMLDSAFAEGGSEKLPRGRSHATKDGRGTVHEISLTDADYAAAYWLLRYMYVEHVDFGGNDEAKEACGNVDDSSALGPSDLSCLLRSTSSLEEKNGHSSDQSSCPSSPVLPQGVHSQTQVQEKQGAFLVDWTPLGCLEWACTFSSKCPTAGAMLDEGSDQSSECSSALRGTLGNRELLDPTHLASGSLPWVEEFARVRLSGDRGGQGRGNGNGDNGNGTDHLSDGVNNEDTNKDGPDSLLRSYEPTRIAFGRSSDPHAHPPLGPSPPAASALTIYRLAHRYGEVRLLAAAEQHVLQHLVPRTAFRVFLATRFFDHLHAGVKRFICAYFCECSLSHPVTCYSALLPFFDRLTLDVVQASSHS